MIFSHFEHVHFGPSLAVLKFTRESCVVRRFLEAARKQGQEATKHKRFPQQLGEFYKAALSPCFLQNRMCNMRKDRP